MAVAYSGAAPVAGATISVFLAGTQTYATIYADTLNTPLANPFTADVLTGLYLFYAAQVPYDIQVSVDGSPVDVTPGVPMIVASGSGASRVISLVTEDQGEQVVLAQVLGHSGAFVQRVTVTLDDAQIKALPTTPITLTPVPNAGVRFKLVGATGILNNHAGVYTNIDATYASLQIETADGSWLAVIGNDSSVSLGDVTTWFNTNHDPASGGTGGILDWLVPTAFPVGANGWLTPILTTSKISVDGQALRLAMDNNGSGDLTGGNAANTFKVILYYLVEAL